MTEQRPAYKVFTQKERAIIEAVANKRRVILAVIQAEIEKSKVANNG